jgi:glycosyltransferase involved in cell wall biosynthesis
MPIRWVGISNKMKSKIQLKKLAIISTHPIQYNAPLFALMAEKGEFELKVFYTWGEDAVKPKFDPDFGKVIEWDIPLLKGYSYQFVKNVAKQPGSHHFLGIDNPDLIQEIVGWGADVVWIWGWSFKSHLKAMRYFHGKIPVWFRGDSTLLDEVNGYSSKSLVRGVLLNWVYRHVDRAFFVGEHNKKYFLKFGLKENQLFHAPHVVDVDRFAVWNEQDARKLEAWKLDLGIQLDDFVILFAGKFEPKKNPNFIISLAKQLKSDRFKFVMVGNGVMESEINEAAKLDKRIIVLPFQNQSRMPMTYRLGDVFVLPSVGPGETWGLAMNEALACGIPVFGSKKCGGSIDLLDDSCGLIFEPNDVITVVERLNALSLDDGQLNDLKENASKRAHKFHYKKIVDAVNQRRPKQLTS